MIQAASCHSLVLRMHGPVQAAATEQLLRAGAVDSWPELAGLRLWEERLPYAAGQPATHSRVRQEAERQLHPTALPLRATLVCYTDDTADLVLVARRNVTFESNAFSFGRATAEEAAASQENPSLEWGLGNPRHAGQIEEVSVPLPDAIDPSAFVAGIELVLSRYDIGNALDEEQTVDGFLARHCPPDSGQLVSFLGVGVIVEEAAPDRLHRPYLTPPLPALFCLRRNAEGVVEGTLRFDHGALSPSVADRFASHVARVAGQLQAGEERRLKEITLLAPGEVEEILRLGSSPAADHGNGASSRIPDVFSRIAGRQPHAIAVTSGTTSLSYRELDELSDLVASGLNASGVRPGDMVGVALERDAELAVVLLGVLKAGCAYVPMDLRHPTERLHYTVENAGITVVVATEGELTEISGVRVVTPEAVRALNSEAPAVTPQESSAAPAYVIYTSGSTGRPKGVVVPHRNVVALVEATKEDFRLGPADVWTLFHSAAFDFSVWEIWGCLLTGGRLVVVDYWTTRDPDGFHALLQREHVTVLNQTPSAFTQLIEADRRSDSSLSTRLVILGGESLDVRILTPWLERYSPARCRLMNMFGITETTVHVTAHAVTPSDVVGHSRHVGRALPGWSVSVRDRLGQVLPVGAVGEIYVGGLGVADRYLGQPELTTERFVTDHCGSDRIYRSGDRGRLLPDGGLEHLGRLDNQVKIRGHRIELDEIRNTLLSHTEVTGAAVVLRDDDSSDRTRARIDAYVALRSPVLTADIQSYSRDRLPVYMVPASVTELTRIPLTINGKLDTAALPPPATTATTAITAITAITSDARSTESAAVEADAFTAHILNLWARLLNVQVAKQDNFFELGGNSLLVIRMLRELRDTGLPRVTPQDFYRNSTANGFIELLRARQH
ncbi:non-ribosomal peptide synthetase [Streptomyces sp. NPDC048208]|uniref:non-ribosomal peptide synthetase n=1 Tax=Streptomyces sp. NPDC048208 TaxID=3365515 RepID=UPI003721600E